MAVLQQRVPQAIVRMVSSVALSSRGLHVRKGQQRAHRGKARKLKRCPRATLSSRISQLNCSMHLSRRVRIREGKYTLHLKGTSLLRFVRSAGGCDHRNVPILPRKKLPAPSLGKTILPSSLPTPPDHELSEEEEREKKRKKRRGKRRTGRRKRKTWRGRGGGGEGANRAPPFD